MARASRENVAGASPLSCATVRNERVAVSTGCAATYSPACRSLSLRPSKFCDSLCSNEAFKRALTGDVFFETSGSICLTYCKQEFHLFQWREQQGCAP